MLKLDIDKFVRVSGEKTTWGFLKKIGFSHWKAHRLGDDRANNITFDDIERLCTAFRCTPTDLFEWVPPSGVTNIEDHPLCPLLKTHSYASEISRLTYEDLKLLAELKSKKEKP